MAVILVESVDVPVTVSPTTKGPDTCNTKHCFFKDKIGGLGDCWYSDPVSTIFKDCISPISDP